MTDLNTSSRVLFSKKPNEENEYDERDNPNRRCLVLEALLEILCPFLVDQEAHYASHITSSRLWGAFPPVDWIPEAHVKIQGVRTASQDRYLKDARFSIEAMGPLLDAPVLGSKCLLKAHENPVYQARGGKLADEERLRFGPFPSDLRVHGSGLSPLQANRSASSWKANRKTNRLFARQSSPVVEGARSMVPQYQQESPKRARLGRCLA